MCYVCVRGGCGAGEGLAWVMEFVEEYPVNDTKQVQEEHNPDNCLRAGEGKRGGGASVCLRVCVCLPVCLTGVCVFIGGGGTWGGVGGGGATKRLTHKA